MNNKDKEALTALLKENHEVYQGISRRIHWTVADSACLDDLMNSKEFQKDIVSRMQHAANSKAVAGYMPSFLAFKAWQRTKAVYSFNNEFVDDIAKTSDTNLYTSLLDRLPFKDMLFFFPEGTLPTIKDEETAGMYVHVERHPEHLWIIFNFIDRTFNNGTQIYPGIAMAFPITNGMKLSGVFETPQYLEWLTVYKRTVFIDRHLNEQEAEECLLATRKALNVAINLLYYLSSQNADIKEVKSSKKTHKAPPMQKKEEVPVVKLHEVGAEYPTIIYRKLKVKSEESKADEELDGESTTTQAAKSPQKRRPHARKAHWQHYWTGKGRSTLEVRWIPDLFVGANRDDQVVVVYDSEKGSLKGKRNPNTSKKKRSSAK